MTEPLFDTTNRTVAQGVLEDLKRTYGDERVLRNKDTIAELMQQNPRLFEDPQTWRAHRTRTH